ncbi:conjugal transfer protein TraN [Falsigemmobacter faecalis]|uniref:Conjugal transfer protein TraN n=1 Tax=Falsigemmobacter faecalis TaxID=2488730 RepID=A0A3P3DP44_9RHOB|nr:conjugal transfer protein TraN [Falsigemmobacter faecalis]RRH74418.1 hypothetical protein EG244_10010 [Falsigemmobacter faecalis]
MNPFIQKLGATLSLIGMIHASVADIAWAQTMDTGTAAGLANTDLFKPNPGALYGNNNGNVEIIGVSPGGSNLSLGTSDLYFGAPPQSEQGGALPQVNTYEDLYAHRDQQIGNLQSGTGNFSSTGSLNAEAAALEVLRGSNNIPSVSGDSFLVPSRDLMDDPNVSAEFGQCIVHQIQEEITHEYTDSVTETCDTLGIDTSPMIAQRQYRGPAELFTYVWDNGHYCQHGGRRIGVDVPETCGKLSILQAIPEATNGGVVRAQSCGGNRGCVELVLDMNNQPHAVGINFTVRSNINLTRANLRFNQPQGTPHTLTYQGGNIWLPNEGRDLPEIVQTRGQIQRLAYRSQNNYVREPASGSIYVPTRYGQPVGHVWNINNDGRVRSIHWDGVLIAEPWQNISSITVGEWTYRPDYSQRYQYVLGWGHPIYRERQGGGSSGTLTTRLEFTEELFTPWVFNANRWAEIQLLAQEQSCNIAYTVNATARNANGCVNALIGSSGQSGQICGGDIPVSPFDGLTDRAATQISVTPICNFGGVDEDGDESFTEANTCTRLEEDETCTYMGRECVEELSNGQCLVYESRYSCGRTLSYTSPVVKEINICNSDMSCFGGDCLPNTGTDGTMDLADAASKLAAVDMILTDMQCTIDPNAANVENEMMACQLFAGTGSNCSRVTLGLSNCCQNAKGVNLADYLQLAFATSRISRIVEGTALANPITSSWVSMENFARDSFSSLTRPITETWEGIIGNSGVTGQGAGALSMEAVKQGMMKNVAQWTSNIFGEQAANAIFQVGGGPAVANGALQQGTISLTSGAASVMSAVMTAYTVYALISVLVEILFACSESEQELQVRKALRSTHEIGTWCSTKILGKCVKRKTGYCMFNSPLARIMNEQARLQLNIPWGPPENPDCRGITLAEFQNLDMERVDLSEWTGMLAASGMLDMSSTNIESMTGVGSTLGRAQEDLYPRENAIDRNLNRLDGIDLDGLRNDAVNDFGMGVVQ